MPVICLTGARFTMNAEVLSWVGTDATGPIIDPPTEGEWVTWQDPITGEIYNRWEPTEDIPDDPLTPEVETTFKTIPCVARGIVDGGIRVAGTTERFGDSYENIDFVKLWVPSNIRLSKRDRVTNIRSKRGGKVIWVDEEWEDGIRPTVFNVNGVTPLFDAMNRHVENFVLLERASDIGTQ